MRIGIVCSDVDIPLLGDEGCSVKLRQFAGALADAGHDVFVVCSWLGDGDARDVGARVYELAPTGAAGTAFAALVEDPVVLEHQLERDLRSVLFNHWMQEEGAAIFDRERPDFLYERHALFGWAGGAQARRLGIPLLLEVNGPLCREQAGYEKFPLAATAERIEARVISDADAVVAVSPWVRDFAVRRGAAPDRVHLVPNGVAAPFLAEPSGAAVRATLGLDDRRVVGYVGSFQPWHDVAGLVRAFAALARERSDASLLLVGDGPGQEAARGEVERFAVGDRTVFAGSLAPAEVPAAIAAMDVPVVPYRSEPDFYFSPLKLFECMAAGRPTVAAALGQIAETVRHGETGWLYEPGDQDSLVAGLRALLAERRRAEAIGAAARAQVLEHYTMRANVDRVVALARALSGGRRETALAAR